MFDVSSSFLYESQERMIEPYRKFTIGDSDFSNLVESWPKIKRQSAVLKAGTLDVSLANPDGAMNEFYKGQYKLKAALKFKIGVPNVGGYYTEVFSDYTFNYITRGVDSLDYVDLIDTTDNNYHYINDIVEMKSAAEVYFDLKVKPEGINIIKLGVSDGTQWPYVLVALDTGSATNQDSAYVISMDVTSEADDFWRIKTGFGYSDVSSFTVSIYLVDSDGSEIYTGNGSNGIWAGDATLNGTEVVDLFTGEINKIEYEDNLCIIKARDKLWDFAQRVIGDTTSGGEVEIPPTSQYLISDIAWTLCTCYGGLSAIESTNNPDIDYASFEAFAEQFSSDNVYGKTFYDGVKVMKAVSDLAHMSDGAIWIEGDGKLVFKRFSEAGSSDISMDASEFSDLTISIDMDRMINQQWVYFDYDVESRYWVGNVIETQSVSVNSFGLRENILKNQNIWYVDSISALNVAVRKSYLMHTPNKKFTFMTGLNGIETQIGDTVRLVDPFYDLTSGQGWTVEGVEYDMRTMKNKYLLDEGLVTDAFYLDISTLDMEHLLL